MPELTFAEIIETAAAGFGIIGALVLACNRAWSGWGFVAFLASNIGWLAFSRDLGFSRMFIQQAVFTATSLVGIWQWLIAPRLASFFDDVFVDPGGDLMTRERATAILNTIRFQNYRFRIAGDFKGPTYLQGVFLASDNDDPHIKREQFTYQGQRVFGPHYDVDALVSLCQAGATETRP